MLSNILETMLYLIKLRIKSNVTEGQKNHNFPLILPVPYYMNWRAVLLCELNNNDVLTIKVVTLKLCLAWKVHVFILSFFVELLRVK